MICDIGGKMKTLAIILAAGFICGCASAPRGSRELPPELLQASERIAGFHENPSPQAFNEIIASHPKTLRWCERNGKPGDAEHTLRLFQVFVSFASKQYGYNGSPYPEEVMAQVVSSVLTMKGASPDDLDVLWAAFFATGDNQHLDRLADAAASSDNALLADAAKWSLNSNYRQHPAVQQYFDQRPEKKGAIIYPAQDASGAAPADASPDQ